MLQVLGPGPYSYAGNEKIGGDRVNNIEMVSCDTSRVSKVPSVHTTPADATAAVSGSSLFAVFNNNCHRTHLAQRISQMFSVSNTKHAEQVFCSFLEGEGSGACRLTPGFNSGPHMLSSKLTLEICKRKHVCNLQHVVYKQIRTTFFLIFTCFSIAQAPASICQFSCCKLAG